MNEETFAVYDAAAARYLTPFFAPTVEFALREFRRAVNKPDHQFNQYPQDYTLFHIGTFNPEDGELIGFPPRAIAVAITLKEPDPQLSLLPEDEANGS
jgi:hypothetical protein